MFHVKHQCSIFHFLWLIYFYLVILPINDGDKFPTSYPMFHVEHSPRHTHLLGFSRLQIGFFQVLSYLSLLGSSFYYHYMSILYHIKGAAVKSFSSKFYYFFLLYIYLSSSSLSQIWCVCQVFFQKKIKKEERNHNLGSSPPNKRWRNALKNLTKGPAFWYLISPHISPLFTTTTHFL